MAVGPGITSVLHPTLSRSQARTAVKAVRNAIAENNKESATELLKTAQKVLDSTAAKKVIHKNAAARTKSRLVKAVKALS